MIVAGHLHHAAVRLLDLDDRFADEYLRRPPEVAEAKHERHADAAADEPGLPAQGVVEAEEVDLGQAFGGGGGAVVHGGGASRDGSPAHAAFLFLTKVMNMIWKSSTGFQFSRYHKSYFTRSFRSVSPRKPFTCAQPVMPGFALCRAL